MFNPKITKEEVNLMPVVVFDGKITLIDEESQVIQAINELYQSPIVGVDTETKPSFARGTHHKVSLVQISTLDHCYLFRLNKIGFPPELAHFLASEKVKKIGLALRDDFSGLNKITPFKPQNFVDIQTIVHNYGIFELGLQKIFAIIFNRKISKNQRLTNWEINDLTEQQQRYAATDAWASLLIYEQFIREKMLTTDELKALVQEMNGSKSETDNANETELA
ncbi:MAG: 3'-5' exonuclease [Paludibacter sp.]|nr:3'-5' exonuclease [Paludibacter sp.]